VTTPGSASLDIPLLRGIRRHFDGLKRTPDGAALHMLIERGLKRYGAAGRIEEAFVGFLHALLERYVKDPKSDPATRVKARLIQQRLTLHLPSAAPGVAAPAVADKPPAPAPTRSRVPPLNPPTSPAAAQPEEPAPAAARVEKLNHMEEVLVDKVTETITFNDEFDSLLKTEERGLQRMDQAIGDFSDLKQLLVKGLDDLIRERQELKEKLSNTAGFLKAVESDRRQLKSELGKYRKHSLTDDMTGLPKREVFVKSLEGEIARVRRYGFSLALAVIDIDGLDGINRQHGREAGDAVLRCYAGEILSNFRTYDLVARYGEDEFAVLFPNTQKEGAVRALEKAQKRVTETYLSHEGKSFPLPGFSSVLTLYAPGEKAVQLLKRADEALDHAKLSGQRRMVVALPTA
jgi:diguanylate cyclase (GGDEF)-like protein